MRAALEAVLQDRGHVKWETGLELLGLNRKGRFDAK